MFREIFKETSNIQFHTLLGTFRFGNDGAESYKKYS